MASVRVLEVLPFAHRTGEDPAPGVTLQNSRIAHEAAGGFRLDLIGLVIGLGPDDVGREVC